MEKVIYLSDVLKECETIDICDNEYDMINAFEYENDYDKTDYYTMCMKFFAYHLEVHNQINGELICCKVTHFIRENMKAFNETFNEIHVEEWQPRNWKPEDLLESDNWYEMYIETFKSFLNGAYPDCDYKVLYENLVKYDKKNLKFTKNSECIYNNNVVIMIDEKQKEAIGIRRKDLKTMRVGLRPNKFNANLRTLLYSLDLEEDAEIIFKQDIL